MKTLREITHGKVNAMRAPEIATAYSIGKTIYVKDKQGNILFILTADQLMGYTSTTVTIRLGNHALTYNNMGTQQTIQTIR